MFENIQNFLRLSPLKLERIYSGGEKATGILDIVQVNDHFFQCHEYGTMILPTGYEGDFSKNFSLRFEGKTIKFYCDHVEEDFYQSITPVFEDEEWRAKAVHHCVNDVYKTDYSFSTEGKLRVIHNVKGPKKDYKSTSVYAK